MAMKFKVIKGTSLFNDLTQLNKKMNKVRAAAYKVAKSFNGTGRYATSGNTLAGGIDAIEFNEKPEGWKSVGNSWQNFYYPKVTNKEANKAICTLPYLSFDEINNLLNFKSNAYTTNEGIVWIKCPEVYWFPTYILISLPDKVKYTPVDGMVEILGSEFNVLNKQK